MMTGAPGAKTGGRSVIPAGAVQARATMATAFQHPIIALTAAALVVAFLFLRVAQTRRHPGFRLLTISNVFLFCVAALLILAIGEPQRRSTGGAIRVIHLLDESASINAPGAQRARAERLQQKLPSGATSAMIAFGGRAVVQSGFSESFPFVSTGDAVDPSRSQPSAAFAAASALAVDSLPCDVILWSDGLYDDAEQSRAVALADDLRRRGHRVYSVAPSAAVDWDVAVASVRCIPNARTRSTISVETDIVASGGGDCVVSLSRVGSGGERTLVDETLIRFDRAGSVRLVLSHPPPDSGHPVGASIYEVAVRPDPASRAEATVLNNTGRAGVDVTTRQPSVVGLCSPESLLPAHLKAVDETGAFISKPVLFSRFKPSDIDDCRVIILDNAPYDALDENSWTAIRRAVTERGAGLLAIGGRTAFALGGHTADGHLETMLPVKIFPDDDQRALLVLVLDVSGSMSEPVAGGRTGYRGGRKIDVLRSAAMRMIQTTAESALKPDDLCAVVLFDASVRNPGAEPISIKAAGGLINDILTAEPLGRTDVHRAVAEAVGIAERTRARFKTIMLVSDGRPQGGDDDFEARQYEALDALMRTRFEQGVETERWRFCALFIGDPSDASERGYFQQLRYLTSEPMGGGGCEAIDPSALLDAMKSLYAKNAGRRFSDSTLSTPYFPDSIVDPLVLDLPELTRLAFRNRVSAKSYGRRLIDVLPSSQDVATRNAEPLVVVGPAGAGRSAVWAAPLVDEQTPYPGRTLLLARLIEFLSAPTILDFAIDARATQAGIDIRLDATGRGESKPQALNGQSGVASPRYAVRRSKGLNEPILTMMDALAPGRHRAIIEPSASAYERFDVVDIDSGRLAGTGFCPSGLSPELSVAGTDAGALAAIAESGGGQRMDNADALAAIIESDPRRESNTPASGGLLLAALGVFFIERLLRAKRSASV